MSLGKFPCYSNIRFSVVCVKRNRVGDEREKVEVERREVARLFVRFMYLVRYWYSKKTKTSRFSLDKFPYYSNIGFSLVCSKRNRVGGGA